MKFLFDLYGTLIDIKTDETSDAFWKKVSGLFLKQGLDVAALRADYAAFCALEKEGKAPLEEIELRNVFARLLEKNDEGPYPGEERIEMFARAFRDASMRKFRLFPGVDKMLKNLKTTGAGIYLLSNAQACFTRDELLESGLCTYFDGIMLSSEIGYKKPSPRFFEAAFEKYGLRREDCVYVGNDLRDDVYGARGVGMKTVYIHTDQSGCYAPNEYLSADYTAKNHVGLEKLLLAMQTRATDI